MKRVSVFLSILMILGLHVTSFAETTSVSGRTPVVRDAIVTAAGVSSASDVTDTHLAAITSLNLRNKRITALKSGDFSGMTALTNLNLYGNSLSSLPDGIFEGLTVLTSLRLGGNTVDPMPITVSLEKVGEDQIKAVVSTGAPFKIVVPISATNGSISGETTSLTISKGSVESTTVTLSRTAGTTVAVTANIGTLPSLPSNHYGYTLSKSDSLPLEVIEMVSSTEDTTDDTTDETMDDTTEPENSAPTFTDGSITVRSIPENSAPAVDIGSVISATDAENDTLTYTLSGIDADTFTLDTTTGQLQTKAALDFETKRVHTVTITVSDGNLTDAITVIISIIDVVEMQYVSTFIAVSDRTPEVRDAILDALPDSLTADNVTEDHLTTITNLNLRNSDITELKTGDFSGLSGLTNLNLYGNMLENLPVGILDGLTALTSLRLGGNLTAPLPLIVSLQQVGVNQFQAVVHTGAPFDLELPITVTNGMLSDGSTEITISNGSVKSEVFTIVKTSGVLSVEIGALPTLPINHFGYVLARSAVCNRTSQVADAIAAAVSGASDCNNVSDVDLATITSLDLSDMSMTSLKADDFSGLLSLSTLDISDNALENLPVGIFEGLISLTSLDISGNSVDPLSITISVEKVGENGVKAGISTGAPFDIVLPLVVANGSLIDNATTITIPRGKIESQHLTVSRTPETFGAVTVEVGSLPSLPATHAGYSLVKSNQIPLTILPALNVAPVFIEGDSATRIVAENTSSGVDIGSPISATDANDDTLTYSLSGTDASSFSIDNSSGQIRTKSPLDYETKSSYSVNVEVSDDEYSDSITVTINITDIDETTTDTDDDTPNTAPVFTDGSTTTRSIAENTGSGVDIGSPVSATDADDDTLTYSLGGTDAASFSIGSTNGQIRTSAALDYETKSSYSVTVSVSDGNEGSDSITVTINITDVDESKNNAPTFTDGDSVSRSVAENTSSGVDIGNAVSATDADDDTLTYSLGGTDATSFSIDSSSGQLRTSAALDYETTSSYSVTISVSDGKGGSDTIAVTINVTDVDEVTNSAPVFTDGDSTTRPIAENTSSGVDIGNAVSATDADNDTLSYSLGGTDADSFSIDSSSGQVRTSASLDYETQSSYTITMTVSDGNGGSDSITVTINVTDVDEATNSAPVFTDGDSTTRSTAENTSSGVDIGSVVSATDADNDTLTYSLGGADASSFSIDSTTGQVRTSASLDYETQSSYTITMTVSDGNGGSDSITVTINVTDVDEATNSAPVFTDGDSTTRSVAENTSSGVDIGSVVSATDADDDTLSYSLGGTDAASFSIDSSSGQLRTSAALDYETKTSYTVTITVSDGNDGTDSITVTINVTDIDEKPANNAPAFTEGSSTTRSIAENTASNTNIGSAVGATDADDDTLTYSLGGTDAASFSINTATGQLRTSAALDFETKKSNTVTVSVFDGNDGTDSITVTINITNVNEAPVFTAGTSTTRSIAENASAGINIGSVVSATDVDSETLTYTLGGTDAASFDIESTSGQLKTKAALDYETKTSYSVTITVSDGSLTDSIAVTINVRDLDETPSNVAPVFTDGESATRTIAENSAANTNIGSAIAATDADSKTLAYLLSGTDASSFTIDSTSGQLKTSGELNYEVKTIYTVTVTVSDGSLTDEITVTINVTNVNEAPVFAGESITREVAENTEAGTNLGSVVTATDPDANDTLTYSLSGTDAASFDIVSTSGQLQTKAALDYETKTSYTVTVTATDAGNATDTITVTINVTDVNENRAPTFASETATRSIDENTGAGVNIGDAVAATDPDTDDTLEYTLGGTDAASFDIGSTNGQLRTKAVLDYETKDSYSVMVSVSDGNGGTDSIAVTINVKDVHENTAPAFSSETETRSIDENTGAGVNIGDAVAATDPDTDDTLEYSLGGTDTASFDIGSTNGQLRTKAALDYETKDAYSVTVSVSDGNGGKDSIAVTINVKDVHENTAPSFASDSTTRSIDENTGAGVNIGDAIAATDPDTDDTLEYSLGGTDAASFDIGSTNGQLRTKAALDYETKDSYSVTVSVSDGNGGTDSIAVTINVNDVNENTAPAFSSETATRSIDENTGAGVNIGAAVSATDADDDTLEYSLGGTDAASFDIGSTNGQLRTKAALDYETKDSYSVTVSVSDGNEGTDSIAVTINVTDVNEVPAFTETSPAARSIAENTAAGTNIGSAVSATDPDTDDSLTYGLGGIDAASFGIDSSTGQLKTKAALDHEDDDAYVITVTVSDNDNLSASITVNISITDVNEAPEFTDGATTTRSIAEETASGQNIGTAVEATDPEGDTLTYSLGGTDASTFSIVSTSGQLQTSGALDYETKTSYSVTITVSDGSLTDTITVTINVTDVTENRAPVFSTGEFSFRVSDIASASVGDSIGTAVKAIDADDDTLSYSLGGDDAALFDIDSSSGQLKITQSLIDHTSSAYSIKVIAKDRNGGTAEKSGTIFVTRIARQITNNPPVFADGESTTRSVAENTASGQNIGSAVSATDDDSDDTLTYSLEGTDAASFSIVSTSGQLQTNAALDYETKTSYSVTVKVTDDSGASNNSDSITVTISITDANDSPVFTNGTTTTRSVAENTASGENIGEPIAATDDDSDDTLTYSLEGTDAASFSIVSTSGQLQTSAALDYETKTSYSVTVKVTDDSSESNNSDTIAVTINVTNVSEGTITPPISDRTPAVRRAIIAAIEGVNNASDVTAEHLAAINSLQFGFDLFNPDSIKLTSLQSGDFNGLTGLTKLDIGSNDLTSLPANVFDDLTSLTILYMYNNELTSLPANVFDNLSSLTELDISSNIFSSLSADIFDNLTSLTELDISFNNFFEEDENTFTTLPDGIFDNLTSLKTLNLGFSGLTSLPDGIFDQLSSLEFLDLLVSEFTTLSADVFDGLSSLKRLDLGTSSNESENQLTSIPSGLFDDLTSLERLDLYGHSFTTLPDGLFDNNTNLEVIAMYNNGITTFPDDIFAELTSLKSLFFFGNDFDSFPEDIFENNTTLESLGLGANQMTTIDAGLFDGLTSLSYLSLTNNKLTSLPVGIFDDLTNLNRLHLDYNELTSLPDNVFDYNTKLTELDIGSNKISSLQTGLFSNLSRLTYLRISWNNISSVPDGIFVGLTSLKRFQCGYQGEQRLLRSIAIKVGLEKVSEGEFKVVCPTGLPFNKGISRFGI